MREMPKPYERYKHFKGREYQVLLIAKNEKTMEDMVVYQALYEPYQIYVRKAEDFLSAVDKEKYPNALQDERFKLIEDDRRNEAARPAATVRSGEAVRSTVPARSTEAVRIEHARSGEAVRTTESARTAETARTEHARSGEAVRTTESARAAEAARPESARSAEAIRTAEPVRTETVRAAETARPAAVEEAREEKPENANNGVDPVLMRFLDAEDGHEQLKVLEECAGKISEQILTPMELSLGMEPSTESVDERIRNIRNNITTRMKYEIRR